MTDDPSKPVTNRKDPEKQKAELLKMLGYAADKGEEYLITMLSDKNMRLDQGKFICKDLAELEKQVQFIRKRSAAERQREQAKLG